MSGLAEDPDALAARVPLSATEMAGVGNPGVGVED
jgi:hypothetical protein